MSNHPRVVFIVRSVGSLLLYNSLLSYSFNTCFKWWVFVGVLFTLYSFIHDLYIIIRAIFGKALFGQVSPKQLFGFYIFI
jgi:hypothetical protein